jgi:hypothetical protein
MLPELVLREIVKLIRAAIKEWGTTLRLATIMVIGVLCVLVVALVW